MSQARAVQALETCAWCGGSGKGAVSSSYVISCLVCGGKGKVTVLQPAGHCRQCDGKGRRDLKAACLSCAGTGWARIFGQ